MSREDELGGAQQGLAAARDAMPAVQLRIGFSTPSAPCQIHLALSGLTCVVDCVDDDLACAYLTAAGVHVEVDPLRGPRFPVRDLPLLLDLPEQISVSATGALRSLLELCLNPPEDGTPAAVTADTPGQLNISWTDGERRFNEALPRGAAPAFVALGIPFVAAADTWELVLSASQVPVVAGFARVNLDGFVEINASSPRHVESAPLPALFRVDGTHYGLPLAHAAALDEAHGFIWEGPRPVLEHGPRELAEPAVPLSAHAQSDLRPFVEALAAERARAVVWSAGLGRRVFCLTAVESLQSMPLLVVCGAHAVWAWQRNLSLFGRTSSLSHDRDDVRIVTYDELARSPRISSPATILFDDLDLYISDDTVMRALRRFDGLLDPLRIACTESFPEQPALQLRFMSVLRPGEFRADQPIALRYPSNPDKRLHEHVEVYTCRRSSAEVGAEMFRRSSVELLDTPESLLTSFEDARQHRRPPDDVAEELLAWCSAGPPQVLSPKLARAAALARESVQARRSAVVVTRHERTASLLRGLLRPIQVSELPQGELDSSRVAVARLDRGPVDLRSFDDVVFVDYPFSSALIEEAVGDASSGDGPSRVTVLHLRGSVDDRLAMIAARRRERSVAGDHRAPLSGAEIEFLLS